MSSDHVVQPTPECHPAPNQLYLSLPVPAGSNLIRLLDLSPLDPDDQDASQGASSSYACSVPLAGTLRIAKLTDSPKFAALSYVWGNDKSLDHTLSISATKSRGADWKLSITKNCHDALVHLRQQFGAMAIWVDSICINQQDNEEKSTQIPLMEEIFTWANPVYVWLGEGNERSDKAMDLLSEIATYDAGFHIMERFLYPNEGVWARLASLLRFLRDVPVQVHTKAVLGWKTRFILFCPHNSPSQRLMTLHDAVYLEDLLASHQQQWSQRVWTLQELLMAGNIKVVRGNKAIAWHLFVCGLNYIQEWRSLNLTWYTRRTLSECIHRWCSLANLWLNIERPYKWNGRTERYPSSDLRRAVTGDSLWRAYAPLSLVVSLSILILFRGDQTWKITAWVQLLQEKDIKGLVRELTLGENTCLILAVTVFIYLSWLCFGLDPGNTPIFSTNGVIFPKKGSSSIAQPKRTIDIIMQEVRHRRASDPKDNSFAIHGILRSFGVALSPPNYEKSLGSVFQELFSDLIAWNSNFMRFLMDVKIQRDPQMGQAPSWVPTFHDCTSSWLAPEYYNGTNRYSATFADEKGALAGTATIATVYRRQLRVPIQRHGTALSCSGVLNSANEIEGLDRSSELLLKNISKFLLWLFHSWMRTPCTPAYESLPKAVLYVLEGRATRPAMDKAFKKWYHTMMDLVTDARDSTKLTDGEFIHQAVETLKADPVISHYFATYCLRISSAKRNLFISSHGYLGSGPDIMVAGDVVALVPGVPVPMIFRSAQEEPPQYTVVGPAFVHGLMEGEDWDKNQLEEVVLI